MTVQIIKKNGKPEWAVLPYEMYQRMVEDTEMLQDVRAYDEAKKALEDGEEVVPSEVAYAILDGANPIKVWREHSGLTRQQLASTVDMSVPYLSQLESGKRKGSTEMLSAIARALDLSLDDIAFPQEQ